MLISHMCYLHPLRTKCTKFMVLLWYAVAQLVEALRYKPEVRGFVYRWGHWDFSLP